jgi:hypothetical protein
MAIQCQANTALQVTAFSLIEIRTLQLLPLSVTAGSNFSSQAMLAPGVSQSVISTTWVAPMLLSQAFNTRQSPKHVPGSLRILLLLAQMLGHLLSRRYQHRYQETVH